jgi:KaiC/GvpD/RAD55 family RecA-like ATPase
MPMYPSQQWFDRSIRIPYELMEFVKRDTYSLLIKGSAGTGKTTLSLTILRALNITDNFFYICTRVSPKQLFLYYPWIAKFEQSQKELTTEASSSEPYYPSSFEDARLDEPESLFERITNELMDVKAPLIIIDSWDAVASFMDREARLNNERVLQTWRERAGAKLIFINEDSTDTSLDFVVDGTVRLKQRLYENIRIREILLLKLRGVKINKPSYVFTLDKGVFQSCETYNSADFVNESNSTIPYITRIQKKKKKKILSPISGRGRFKTGYKELDVNLGGGFPKKGIVVLELDQNINVAVVMAFLSKIILNFITTDNRIFFYPVEGIDAISAISHLKSYLSINPESRTPKIFLLGNEATGLPDFMVSCYDNKDSKKKLELFHNSVVKERQKAPNRLFLSIMITDELHKIDSEAKMKLFQFIRKNIDLFIFVVRDYKQTHLAPARCDAYLRFMIINGSLFLESINPLSFLLAVVTNKSKVRPGIDLISMV